MRVKLTKENREYLQHLLDAANDNLDHLVAKKDAVALKKALQGVPSKQLLTILNENLDQIESLPIYRLTSQDQVKEMQDLLIAFGGT